MAARIHRSALIALFGTECQVVLPPSALSMSAFQQPTELDDR
ncbi:hypothetical protein ABZ172_22980 [Streptomyces sp. NPDC006296]